MNSEFFVNLWLTHCCNFRCRYCYAKHDFKDSDLNPERVADIIDFIKSNIKADQALKMVFHGGEPLLKMDIIKLVVDIAKKEITNPVSFGITTNGSLIKEEDIDFLIETFTYDLSISIDGKKETHLFNRMAVNKQDYFDVILCNAKKLVKKKPNTRIRMTFDRYNINALAENIIFFIEMGFKTIVPGADIFSKEWTSEDFEQVKKQLLIVKNYIESKHMDINLYEISNEFTRLSPCTAGDDYYSIDSDGKIYPCLFLVGNTEVCIGDIYSGINRGKYNELYRINHQKIEECSECSMQPFCNSNRCLLINYATTGEYLSPNLVECNMLNIKYAISTEAYRDICQRYE